MNSEVATRNLAALTPLLIVKDLQASIVPYVERFGFQLEFEGPSDAVYYARVSRDGVGVMLKTIAPDVLPRTRCSTSSRSGEHRS